MTLCNFLGALSWWGPLYVEDAIRVRKEYGLESSVEEDRYDISRAM